MSYLTVTGDVIMFRQEAVGRIRSDLGATVRDELNLAIEGGSSPELDELFEVVIKRLKEEAEAGMIEVAQLKPIFDDIKANANE